MRQEISPLKGEGGVAKRFPVQEARQLRSQACRTGPLLYFGTMTPSICKMNKCICRFLHFFGVASFYIHCNARSRHSIHWTGLPQESATQCNWMCLGGMYVMHLCTPHTLCRIALAAGMLLSSSRIRAPLTYLPYRYLYEYASASDPLLKPFALLSKDSYSFCLLSYSLSSALAVTVAFFWSRLCPSAFCLISFFSLTLSQHVKRFIGLQNIFFVI